MYLIFDSIFCWCICNVFGMFAQIKSDPRDTKNIILGRMADAAPLSLLGRDVDINEDIAVNSFRK